MLVVVFLDKVLESIQRYLEKRVCWNKWVKYLSFLFLTQFYQISKSWKWFYLDSKSKIFLKISDLIFFRLWNKIFSTLVFYFLHPIFFYFISDWCQNYISTVNLWIFISFLISLILISLDFFDSKNEIF